LSGTEVLFCQVQKYYFCNPYFEDFVWFGSGGGGGGIIYYYGIKLLYLQLAHNLKMNSSTYRKHHFI